MVLVTEVKQVEGSGLEGLTENGEWVKLGVPESDMVECNNVIKSTARQIFNSLAKTDEEKFYHLCEGDIIQICYNVYPRREEPKPSKKYDWRSRFKNRDWKLMKAVKIDGRYSRKSD